MYRQDGRLGISLMSIVLLFSTVLFVLACAPVRCAEQGMSLPVEFSPDDKLVAAVRPSAPSGCRLVLLDVSGQNPARTLACAESISSVRYSPDGQHICITARGVMDARNLRTVPEHDGDDLYIVELDGSAPLRLTYQGAASPTYSPTGEAIAYIGRGGEIAAIDIEGHNWRIVTRIPPTKTIQSWLADKKSFVSSDTADGYIARYAFTPPARHPVRISPKHVVGRNTVSPVISPEGKTLAYIMGGQNDELPIPVRVFLQEKDVPRLLATCENSDRAGMRRPGLTWSSTGGELAISASSVWILDANTGRTRKLTDDEASASLPETPS